MAKPIRRLQETMPPLMAAALAGSKVRTALVGAADTRYLEAVHRALGDGFLEVTLIGPIAEIHEKAAQAGIALEGMPIVNAVDTAAAIAAASRLVANGSVDMLIRGHVPVAALLTALFHPEVGFRLGKKPVSHVALLEHDEYPRLLILSDAAVNIAPDLPRKLAIIDNAVMVAGRLGIDLPNVALLAAVEAIYPAMPVTMEEAVIAKMADKGQIKNCRVDGPLSMDVAIVPEVARQKGAVSAVAGQADILIAPNIETAAGVYKAMALFTKAKMAGAVVGGKIPIALPSRCDTVDTIYYSILVSGFLAVSGR